MVRTMLIFSEQDSLIKSLHNTKHVNSGLSSESGGMGTTIKSFKTIIFCCTH